MSVLPALQTLHHGQQISRLRRRLYVEGIQEGTTTTRGFPSPRCTTTRAVVPQARARPGEQRAHARAVRRRAAAARAELVVVGGLRLWWPNGYGPQHTYRVTATLLDCHRERVHKIPLGDAAGTIPRVVGRRPERRRQRSDAAGRRCALGRGLCRLSPPYVCVNLETNQLNMSHHLAIVHSQGVQLRPQGIPKNCVFEFTNQHFKTHLLFSKKTGFCEKAVVV